MNYKIRKFSNFKKRKILDTYEPEKRIEFSKEDALPWIVRLGHRLMCLGGLVGFWASSGLMLIKGFFGFKKKIDNFSLNNKVIELRIRR